MVELSEMKMSMGLVGVPDQLIYTKSRVTQCQEKVKEYFATSHDVLYRRFAEKGEERVGVGSYRKRLKGNAAPRSRLHRKEEGNIWTHLSTLR